VVVVVAVVEVVEVVVVEVEVVVGLVVVVVVVAVAVVVVGEHLFRNGTEFFVVCLSLRLAGWLWLCGRASVCIVCLCV